MPKLIHKLICLLSVCGLLITSVGSIGVNSASGKSILDLPLCLPGAPVGGGFLGWVAARLVSMYELRPLYTERDDLNRKIHQIWPHDPIFHDQEIPEDQLPEDVKKEVEGLRARIEDLESKGDDVVKRHSWQYAAGGAAATLMIACPISIYLKHRTEQRALAERVSAAAARMVADSQATRAREEAEDAAAWAGRDARRVAQAREFALASVRRHVEHVEWIVNSLVPKSVEVHEAFVQAENAQLSGNTLEVLDRKYNQLLNMHNSFNRKVSDAQAGVQGLDNGHERRDLEVRIAGAKEAIKAQRVQAGGVLQGLNVKPEQPKADHLREFTERMRATGIAWHPEGALQHEAPLVRPVSPRAAQARPASPPVRPLDHPAG